MRLRDAAAAVGDRRVPKQSRFRVPGAPTKSEISWGKEERSQRVRRKANAFGVCLAPNNATSATTSAAAAVAVPAAVAAATAVAAAAAAQDDENKDDPQTRVTAKAIHMILHSADAPGKLMLRPLPRAFSAGLR